MDEAKYYLPETLVTSFITFQNFTRLLAIFQSSVFRISLTWTNCPSLVSKLPNAFVKSKELPGKVK